MANDSSRITVAQRGSIHIGDVGVLVSPDPAVAVPGSFEELGYTTEDGVSFSTSADVTDINAWQSTTPVRRIVTGRGISVGFTLEEWKEANFKLAFGGGYWTEASGVSQYHPPAATEALDEYALVVDFQDGDEKSRLVVYRGNVADSVETTLTRSGAALLPITFTGLAPDGQDRNWRYSTTDTELASEVGS